MRKYVKNAKNTNESITQKRKGSGDWNPGPSTTHKIENEREKPRKTMFGKVIYNRKTHYFDWNDYSRLICKKVDQVIESNEAIGESKKRVIWGILQCLMKILETRKLVDPEMWHWTKSLVLWIIEEHFPRPWDEMMPAIMMEVDRQWAFHTPEVQPFIDIILKYYGSYFEDVFEAMQPEGEI